MENGAIVLGAGNPLTGVTWAGSFPKTGYEVRFEAARLEGGDFFASLTFPVGDSHCTWVTGGWGGDIVGLSSLDGWDASDNETRSYYEFEKRRWYAFRLQVTPERISAWIDEKPIVKVEIAGRSVELRAGEIKLSAPLGFASYATTSGIRRVEYRRLRAPREAGAKRRTIPGPGPRPLAPRGAQRRGYPFSFQPFRYSRLSHAFASCAFVTRPVAGSYSRRFPAWCATRPSSICSIIVPV